MDYTIYTVLGIIFVVYLFMTIYGKKQSRTRKDRKFMEGYGSSKRKREKNEEED